MQQDLIDCTEEKERMMMTCNNNLESRSWLLLSLLCVASITKQWYHYLGLSLIIYRFDAESKHVFVGDYGAHISIIKLENNSPSLVTTLNGHSGKLPPWHSWFGTGDWRLFCHSQLIIKTNLIEIINCTSIILWILNICLISNELWLYLHIIIQKGLPWNITPKHYCYNN